MTASPDSCTIAPVADARRSRVRIAFARIRREGGTCARCAAPLAVYERLALVKLEDRAGAPRVVVCGRCASRLLT